MAEKQNPSCGFLYCSYGPEFIDEAFESIRTLQTHNPSAKICIVTDKEGGRYIEGKYGQFRVDKVIVKEIRMDLGWISKTYFYEDTPYDRTLYLDSDTYITCDIQNLFDLLETFDFVGVPDEAHPARGSIIGLKGGYAALGHYNAGMFLFRKSEPVRKLFEEWRKFYLELVPVEFNDQGPLVRALIKTIDEDHLKFITLPREYNLRLTNQCVSFQHHVKIIHGRARDPQKLFKTINDFDYVCTGSRVWVPNLQRIIRAEDFRWIGRILRFFNLDNVQKEVYGRKPVKSVWRKLKDVCEVYWKVLKKMAAAKKAGGNGFFPPPEKREEWEKSHAAILDFLTAHHDIRSFLDCESEGNPFSGYFERKGIEAFVSDKFGGAPLEHLLAEKRFDLVCHYDAGVRADTRRMHHLVRTLCKNSSRFILLINHLLPAQRRFDFSPAKTDWYWIQLISDRGFYFDPHLSKKLREISGNRYFRENCLFFERHS